MALTDEYRFFAAAGKGGDGVVRWRREKFRPKGGPCGGDGGKGGDVGIEAIRDITYLGHISHTHEYRAEDGHEGGSNSRHGADGQDLTIKLPVGSVITNTKTGAAVELLREGEVVRLLAGGAGGFGNEHFKSSTNQRPMQATKGAPGEAGSYTVELRLIADVGLVGLPNAGKTSLLNALTNAGARVGAYPFTTLDPNLGVYHKCVIADIPGLIEGASSGKGLGHKFLRHISRTRVILHCISLERDDIVTDFDEVEHELAKYAGVSDIPRYVVLTKTDTTDSRRVYAAIEQLTHAREAHVLAAISILDDASIKTLGDKITQVVVQHVQ